MKALGGGEIMEKVVKAQGVLVASMLLVLVSLPAVAVAVNGHPAVPAGLPPGTHCDCETR